VKPTSVKILHKTYKIVWKKTVRCSDGHEVDGACDVDAGKLWVSTKLTGQNRRLTLLHEILHAIHGEWGLIEKEEGEERVVDITSKALIDIFDHNEEVRKYLCES